MLVENKIDDSFFAVDFPFQRNVGKRFCLTSCVTTFKFVKVFWCPIFSLLPTNVMTGSATSLEGFPLWFCFMNVDI